MQFKCDVQNATDYTSMSRVQYLFKQISSFQYAHLNLPRNKLARSRDICMHISIHGTRSESGYIWKYSFDTCNYYI